MERISGPVHGHWLVTYTVASRQGHWGYTKICRQRPSHVWDGTPALAKVACGPFRDERAALVLATDAASERLARHARRMAAA
jgi:hypothetical protein